MWWEEIGAAGLSVDWGKHQFAKLPYASVLFGDSPEETFKVARGLKERGFSDEIWLGAAGIEGCGV